MKSLINSLISSVLTEEEISNLGKNKPTSTIGVFGGGFQPPTKGHFEVVKQALQQYPELDKFIIFVGTGGGRSETITQDQSVAIWNIYKQYLSSKVSIVPSSNPRNSIYSLRRKNPDTKIKWFLGSRKGKEEDFTDFEKALNTITPERSNLELINIVTADGISGTAARAVLDNKEKLFTYLPDIEETDKEQIYSILHPVEEGEEITMWVSEEEQPSATQNFFEPLPNQDTDIQTSSEPTRVEYYKDHIKNVVPSDFKVERHKDKIVVSNINKSGLEHNKDFKDKLISLTVSMIDNGLNLRPLPDITFIEDDKDNASNILGRTAHYDHDQKCITLYTYGRHPKDILRSYAHEMIHHMQNLEGRIHSIEGQNINEDEYLKELELEAYSKGNMCFRSWENNLKND